MNKLVLSQKDTIKLTELITARFIYQGRRHTVQGATPEIFNKWVHQYVEEVQGVDPSIWPCIQRWNIINHILAEQEEANPWIAIERDTSSGSLLLVDVELPDSESASGSEDDPLQENEHDHEDQLRK